MILVSQCLLMKTISSIVLSKKKKNQNGIVIDTALVQSRNYDYFWNSTSLTRSLCPLPSDRHTTGVGYHYIKPWLRITVCLRRLPVTNFFSAGQKNPPFFSLFFSHHLSTTPISPSRCSSIYHVVWIYWKQPQQQ